MIWTAIRRTGLVVTAVALIVAGCGGDGDDNSNGSSSGGSTGGSSQTTSETSTPTSIPAAADLYIEIALRDEPDKNWSTSSDCAEWRSTAGSYGGEPGATDAFIAKMQALVKQDPDYAPFEDLVNRGIVGQLYEELLGRCGIG